MKYMYILISTLFCFEFVTIPKIRTRMMLLLTLFLAHVIILDAQKIGYVPTPADYSEPSIFDRSIIAFLRENGFNLAVDDSEKFYNVPRYNRSKWNPLARFLSGSQKKYVVDNKYNYLLYLDKVELSEGDLGDLEDIWAHDDRVSGQVEFVLFDAEEDDYKRLVLNVYYPGIESESNHTNLLVEYSSISDFTQGLSEQISRNGELPYDRDEIVVLRVKHTDPITGDPDLLTVYHEGSSLSLGATISVSKVDTIVVNGIEMIDLTTIGSAVVTESFNHPLYTAKLSSKASKYFSSNPINSNLRGNLMEAPSSDQFTPRVMVLPEMLEATKFHGEGYNLTDDEKLIIASLKNALENFGYTTVGFESYLKQLSELNQMESKSQLDIKYKILESSGANFYIEFSEVSRSNCKSIINFKIRNYSTSEDVASDVKSLERCTTDNDPVKPYKSWAKGVIGEAKDKMENQFDELVTHGRKVNLSITFRKFSDLDFFSQRDGYRIEEWIEEALKKYTLDGKYTVAGVTKLKMMINEAYVPVFNELDSQVYSVNSFALDVVHFLREQAGIICEKNVVRNNVIITIL